jgi:hypothetical protein
MADATQILYSMAQFKPEEFGLPPFEEWDDKRALLRNDPPWRGIVA